MVRVRASYYLFELTWVIILFLMHIGGVGAVFDIVNFINTPPVVSVF